MRDFIESVRFMFANPEKFGQSEVGEGGIRNELDEFFAADGGMQPVALRLSALVGPDESRTKDLAFCVEHNAAVHLTGEGDGVDFLRVTGGYSGFEATGDGKLGGAPPVFGVLLGPADLRRTDPGVGGGVGCEK